MFWSRTTAGSLLLIFFLPASSLAFLPLALPPLLLFLAPALPLLASRAAARAAAVAVGEGGANDTDNDEEEEEEEEAEEEKDEEATAATVASGCGRPGVLPMRFLLLPPLPAPAPLLKL